MEGLLGLHVHDFTAWLPGRGIAPQAHHKRIPLDGGRVQAQATLKMIQMGAYGLKRTGRCFQKRFYRDGQQPERPWVCEGARGVTRRVGSGPVNGVAGQSSASHALLPLPRAELAKRRDFPATSFDGLTQSRPGGCGLVAQDVAGGMADG
jgi:hypothetical protein